MNAPRRRVMILTNPEKPGAVEALERLEAFARSRAVVVGAYDSLAVEAALREKPDRIFVLGGDGTLIGVARALGHAQTPLIGVNLGKLGFLVEFSLKDALDEFDRSVSDDSAVSRRLMLEVAVGQDAVSKPDAPTHASLGGADERLFAAQGAGPRAERTLLAVNDCVFQMGPPFRMIALNVALDGNHLTHIRGDGLAVCTPSGSTAHSLSAGGPVMGAELRAIGITPLNAHSLTHRPIVVGPEAVIEVRPETVNSGSSVILDGQETIPLKRGAVVRIRRSPSEFLLVRNPRRSAWHNLVTKLHWGQPPTE